MRGGANHRLPSVSPQVGYNVMHQIFVYFWSFWMFPKYLFLLGTTLSQPELNVVTAKHIVHHPIKTNNE